MRWISTLAAVTLVMLATAASISAAEVSGWVRGPDGGASAGTTVTLQPEDGGGSQERITDDEGRYAFDRVAPGRYQLEAANVTRRIYVEPGYNTVNIRQ